MSKERFQRILENNIVMAIRDSRKDKEIDIDAIADDVNWLLEEKIQLEERVETLNGAIDELKHDEEVLRNKYKNLWRENQHLEERVKELKQEIDGMTYHEEYRDNEYEKLYAENQRYKRALESIKEHSDDKLDVHIARQALQGGKDNE